MSLPVEYRAEAQLRQGFQADAVQFFRDAVIVLARRAGLETHYLLHEFRLRIRTERLAPDQQLIEDDAQAEEVAAAIDPVSFAPCLFRTHVGGRPGVTWSLAHILFAQRQAEIPDKRLATLVEQDIAGLDVPMHEPLLVGVMQRLRHRRHQFDGFVQRQPGLLEPGGEVGAIDVLRDDVAGAVFGATDIEDRNDVRMIEVGDGTGFGQVGIGGFGVIHQLAVRQLNGDEPLQLIVVGQIDEAEAALTEDLLYAVATNVLWLRSGNGGGGGLVATARMIITGSLRVVHSVASFLLPAKMSFIHVAPLDLIESREVPATAPDRGGALRLLRACAAVRVF